MEQRTFGPARNVSPQTLRGLHDDGATPDVPTPKRWEFEGFTLDLAGRTLTDAFGENAFVAPASKVPLTRLNAPVNVLLVPVNVHV